MSVKKMNDAVDAVVVVNQQGDIVRLNPVAARLFGYDEMELVGKPVSSILPSVSGVSGQNLVFDVLNNKRIETMVKSGLRKGGSAFPVELFVVPFKMETDRFFCCVVKDDTNRFFYERVENLANIILRRVLVGEELKDFADFIVEQISLLFPLPNIWVGSHRLTENGVTVLSSKGKVANMVQVGNVYLKKNTPLHPSIAACEKMEITSDEFEGEKGVLYKRIAFPFISEKDVVGVLCVSAPLDLFNHVVLNRLENIALRLGMILQIAEDQNYLRLLGTAISSAINAVFIMDAQHKIIWVNDAFEKVSGYSKVDVLGKTPDFLSVDFRTAYYQKGLMEKIKDGASWRGELTYKRKDGKPFIVEQMLTPILNKERQVTHYVAVNDDLTAKKEAEGKILQLSNYDQLTGLANRRLFLEKLSEAVSSAVQTKERLAVLYLDLSNFSRFNDTMGHVAGDLILKIVADRIMSCVSNRDLVARIDGDEYAIILRHLKKYEEAGDTCKSILKAIEQPIKIEEKELVLTACGGISLCPADARETEKIVNYADMALFKAKGLGMGNYFFFSKEMNQEIEERTALEGDIRRAFINREFFLNYQPQISLKTGRVVGFEALVRWQHPTKGLISPALFVSLAEEFGLIGDLFAFVLEEALMQLKNWRQIGYDNITVAVNVSPAQFDDENLLSLIKKTLNKSRVRTAFLELEVTEGLLMKDAEKANNILQELSKLGIRIAVDDFGTGYSSLSYLTKFPVDKLKIDKSFVSDMLSHSENMEVVNAIISLGHALKLDVIAEGVETNAECSILSDLDCDMVQGFLFGKPMSADDALSYLKIKNGVPLPRGKILVEKTIENSKKDKKSVSLSQKKKTVKATKTVKKKASASKQSKVSDEKKTPRLTKKKSPEKSAVSKTIKLEKKKTATSKVKKAIKKK